MSTNEKPAEETGGDEGFWSAAGDLDEAVAEEHASKIFALWELGGEFEKMKPAEDGTEEDGGAWAADAPATDAAPATSSATGVTSATDAASASEAASEAASATDAASAS